jgi:hypothetical protein
VGRLSRRRSTTSNDAKLGLPTNSVHIWAQVAVLFVGRLSRRRSTTSNDANLGLPTNRIATWASTGTGLLPRHWYWN